MSDTHVCTQKYTLQLNSVLSIETGTLHEDPVRFILASDVNWHTRVLSLRLKRYQVLRPSICPHISQRLPLKNLCKILYCGLV